MTDYNKSLHQWRWSQNGSIAVKKRPGGEDKGVQHKLYYLLKFSVNYLSYCTDIAKIFSLGLGTKPDETRPGFLFPKCAEIHHAFVVYKIF